jgi:hypothetical protein
MDIVEDRIQKINRIHEIIDESKKILFVQQLKVLCFFVCFTYLVLCALKILDINVWFLLFYLTSYLSVSLTAAMIIRKRNSTLPDSIIQLLNKKIDEEGSAYLGDLKAEWIKSGEPQYLIKIKELIFILDYLRGSFIGWIQFQKTYKQLQNSPEDKLEKVYDMIHHFRLDLEAENLQPRSPGLLKGTLGDAFFEPLSEEELQAWE